MKQIVGGGPKKVLYTLNTVRRIGLKDSAKALMAKNACKACGLGMGGQQGGMTNEKGEFPSVCNKSIQAQSTDIQLPIPSEVFQHTLADLKELSAQEVERLGRLSKPIYKAKDSDKYAEVSWQWAIEHCAKKFKQARPEKSFFYTSGRSSMEAGYLLQLVARSYGTNNITNCSYYCHQATGVGLATTIGTGTSTVELNDLSLCDTIFIIGANPASNHPRLIHQLKGIRDRGGQVIVINPAKEPGLVKFAVPKSPKSMIGGGTEIASFYLQPKVGSDMALLKGLAKATIERGFENSEFINQYSENHPEFLSDLNNTSWETIETQTGLEKKQIMQCADIYGASKKAVFAWGMGVTHHKNGSDNVEYIANLAMLRGMVGKQGAGLLPLRGHSNVQGIGTVGVKPYLPAEMLSALEENMGRKFDMPPGLDTVATLEAAYEGEMDCAMLMGGNLYSASPNSVWTQTAMNRIGFKVYLTTTLNQGHIYGVEESESLVLPVLARDEEPQATTQESMFNYVRLSDGGISRLDGPLAEVEVLARFAQQLLDVEKWKGYEDTNKIRRDMAQTVPGMQNIADIGTSKIEFHIENRIKHQPEFYTANRKANFAVCALPDQSPNGFEFLLSSVRSEGQFNSIIYEETDSYRNNADRYTILMNKLDMQKLGLKTADKITLESAVGQLEQFKVQAFEVAEGGVLGYYPEVNPLISMSNDPRSKTPAFKSIPVNIKKS